MVFSLFNLQIQDVPTRWNSTYQMIKRLISHKASITALLSDPNHKHKVQVLNETEWGKLVCLRDLLEPCERASDTLGGQKYVSCSTILPIVSDLLVRMTVVDEDPAYVVRFKTALSTHLLEIQQTYKSNECVLIATCMDPRFKSLKCLPRADRAAAWDAVGRVVGETVPCVQQESPVKKAKVLPLRSLYDSDDDDESQPGGNECDRYRALPLLTHDESPHLWWRQRYVEYPRLAAVALKYLCVPATSVPCERVFSVAGAVVNKKRASLSSDSTNELVCLNNWLKNK